MKKVNLIILSVLILSSFLSAQDEFSITPKTHEEIHLNVILDQNDDFVSESIMANLTDETLQINWRILEKNQPEEWRIAISDLDMDYLLSNIVSNSTPGPLNAHPLVFEPDNDNGIFNIHFYPKLVNGCADLSVEVSNATTGLVYDTISYQILINECEPVSNLESFKDVGISFSPNPIRDLMKISAPARNVEIEILNATGIVVSSYEIYNEAPINLASQPSGMYILSAIIDGKRLKSERFIKQ